MLSNFSKFVNPFGRLRIDVELRRNINPFGRLRIDVELRRNIKNHQEDIILLIAVILISLLSFATGYITAKYQKKESIKIQMTVDETAIVLYSEHSSFK